MHNKLLVLAALLTLTACAPQSNSTTVNEAADSPPYEMMKDQVIEAKMESYFKAAIKTCPLKSEAELLPCARSRIIQVWPKGGLAAPHCASRSDPYEELDCITMTSLAVDLIERTGTGNPAEFVASLGADNAQATGDAAARFGKAIWNLCPDGANARHCRVDATVQKLNLTEADAARCAPLKDDRKTVSCLMLSRIRNEVGAATLRLAAIGT
jgi:hypothetical protein